MFNYYSFIGNLLLKIEKKGWVLQCGHTANKKFVTA